MVCNSKNFKITFISFLIEPDFKFISQLLFDVQESDKGKLNKYKETEVVIGTHTVEKEETTVFFKNYGQILMILNTLVPQLLRIECFEALAVLKLAFSVVYVTL